jgi:formiminotetrahydrofolate cyclodeaminase
MSMSQDPGAPYPAPLGTLPARDLLEDVARGNMAPGGMGMTALMGAIAAVLVAMVGKLTAGNPGYEPMTEEMERLTERAKTLADQVLTGLDQEVAAFNKLVESMALPRDNDEQAIMRRDCIRIAARAYAQVPLQVGQVTAEVLQLAETAVRYGNKEILADAGTALLAAIAAVKAASLQVLINLRGQEPDEWVAEAREKVAKWLENLPALEQELWDLLLQQVS